MDAKHLILQALRVTKYAEQQLGRARSQAKKRHLAVKTVEGRRYVYSWYRDSIGHVRWRCVGRLDDPEVRDLVTSVEIQYAKEVEKWEQIYQQCQQELEKMLAALAPDSAADV